MAAIVVTIAAPIEARADCHHFSIWHYPWAQRCSHARPPARRFLAVATKPAVETPDPEQESEPEMIPIPDLQFVECGEADEEARARILLRANLNGDLAR